MSGSYGRGPTYVSPFVADALYRAKLRASKATKTKPARKRRDPSVRDSEDVPEWNSSVTKNSLFDPQLHKKEIFKIEPRRPGNSRPGPRSDHHPYDADDASGKDRQALQNQSDEYGGQSSRMTRRRTEPTAPQYPYPSTHNAHQLIDKHPADSLAYTEKELSKPYVKVCSGCHAGPGGTHSHAQGSNHHHGPHTSPARHKSPHMSTSAVGVSSVEKQSTPHRPQRQLDENHHHSRGHANALGANSWHLDDGDEDFVRLVTRATSPIDETTLRYLEEGRDPAWLALSGLDREEIPPAPPSLPLATAFNNESRRPPPYYRDLYEAPTPMHNIPNDTSIVKSTSAPSPAPSGFSRSAPRTHQLRAEEPNSPFIGSTGGSPVKNNIIGGNFDVPRFRSSLDDSFIEPQRRDSFDGDPYKKQIEAQSKVIENIAKMLDTMAMLNKKKPKRRSRRYQSNQPITIHIDQPSHFPLAQTKEEAGSLKSTHSDTAPTTLSRAAIMDLILAKLQNLDKFEKEIAAELFSSTSSDAASTDAAVSNNPDKPTVPVAAPDQSANKQSVQALKPAVEPVLDMMSLLASGKRPISTDILKKNPKVIDPIDFTNSETMTPSSPIQVTLQMPQIAKSQNRVGAEKQKSLNEKRLVPVQYNKEKKHEFMKYLKEFENNKAMKEVPYRENGLTLVDVVDGISDSLYEEYVLLVSKEIGRTLESYAEDLFEAI